MFWGTLSVGVRMCFSVGVTAKFEIRSFRVSRLGVEWVRRLVSWGQGRGGC